jgi:hypothetical protein
MRRCITAATPYTPDTLASAMTADPPISPDVLERSRAYVRVDSRVIASLPALGEAISAFKPVPGPAGESVATWLAERALREPQEATARVRLSHGNVTGVYALCAAQVALGSDDRAQLGGVHYRTQPAILLAQFARADESPGIGEELLRHANTIAQRALRYVGATVLVVDPFDSDTADMWRQRFGFQDSEQPMPGNSPLRRQWLSFQS